MAFEITPDFIRTLNVTDTGVQYTFERALSIAGLLDSEFQAYLGLDLDQNFHDIIIENSGPDVVYFDLSDDKTDAGTIIPLDDGVSTLLGTPSTHGIFARYDRVIRRIRLITDAGNTATVQLILDGGSI